MFPWEIIRLAFSYNVSYSHIYRIEVASVNLRLYISVSTEDAICLILCLKPTS